MYGSQVPNDLGTPLVSVTFCSLTASSLEKTKAPPFSSKNMRLPRDLCKEHHQRLSVQRWNSLQAARARKDPAATSQHRRTHKSIERLPRHVLPFTLLAHHLLPGQRLQRSPSSFHCFAAAWLPRSQRWIPHEGREEVDSFLHTWAADTSWLVAMCMRLLPLGWS